VVSIVYAVRSDLHNYIVWRLRFPCQKKRKKYHHASHSKYLLLAHLVFACKYRKKLLKGQLAADMKQILLGIAANSDFDIDVLESNIDHIHIMVDYSPTLFHLPNRAAVEVSVHQTHLWRHSSATLRGDYLLVSLPAVARLHR
jgi:REP element-mobilizing transposase RayT